MDLKGPATLFKDPISTIEWSKSIQQFFKLTHMGNPLVQHLKMQNNNYLYKKWDFSTLKFFSKFFSCNLWYCICLCSIMFKIKKMITFKFFNNNTYNNKKFVYHWLTHLPVWHTQYGDNDISKYKQQKFKWFLFSFCLDFGIKQNIC